MSDFGEMRLDITTDTSGLSQAAKAANELAESYKSGAGKAGESLRRLEAVQKAVAKSLAASAKASGKQVGQAFQQGLKQATQNAPSKAAQAQQAQIARAALVTQRQQAQLSIITARQQARAQSTAQSAAAAQQNITAQRSAQLQITAARTAGQQRVAITRATVDAIVAIERGLIRAVEGTARTVVSGIRRIFAGTVGSIQRSFAERRQIITRNLNSEVHLFSEQSARIAAIQARSQRGLAGSLLRNLSLFGGGFLFQAALRATFTLGSQFARGLNVLQAQLKLTDEQLASVDKLSIKLGNDIGLPGVSALDAAQAIGLLGKQFATLGDQAVVAASAAAKGTLQLSRAVGSTAEDAASAVGAAVNTFGVAADQAVSVADSFAAAVAKAGGADFTNFRDALAQGAAVFSQFQVPAVGAKGALDEFNAAIAVLAKGGLAGSDAGAALKQFFLQANRAAPAAGEALKKVAQRAGIVGGVFFDQQKRARDLTSVINILNKGLAGLSDQERTATLQTIFGSRGISAANIILKEGGANFLTLVAALQEEGSAARLAAAQNKGLAGALDAIKSQFETFAILIFQKVNPILGRAGLALAGFIDRLANGEGTFAVVRKGLLGIAAGLGAVLAVKGAVEILGLLAKTLPLLLTPFGALSALAAALGAAFFIAGRQSKGFTDQLHKTLDVLKSAGQAVGRFFQAQVLPVLASFADFAARQVEPLTKRVKELASSILTFLKPAIAVLKTFGLQVAGIFRSLKVGDFAQAKQQFALLGKELVFTVVKPLQRLGVEALRAVQSGLGTALGALRGLLSNALGRALAGAGVGAVAGGVLLGPIGVILGVALGGAFEAAARFAIPRLREALGRIDVPAVFGKFLKGVSLVGRRIGEILSDKRTILAVAGIAAAAGAIAVTFVQGFVAGILSNLGDIRAAGVQIVTALAQAIVNAPAIVKAVLALAIIFRSKIISLFTKTGVEAGEAFSTRAVATIASRFGEGAGALASLGLTIGKGLGQALTIGLTAALSGAALGGATSNIERGLGLAGIAGSAAQAFVAGSALSGGNLAIGASAAAASVLVSGLSAAFAANAKAADRNKAAVKELESALTSGGVAEATKAITDNLKDLPTKTKELLNKTSFNIDDFIAALQKGPKAGEAFVESVGKQIFALTGNLDDVDRVIGPLFDTVDHFALAEKDAAVNAELLSGGLKRLGVNASVTGVFVQKAAAFFNEAISKAREERTKKQIETLQTNAQTLKTEADKAREALRLLITGDTATAAAATNQAVVDIPGTAAAVQEGIANGVQTALGSAQIQQGLQPFKEDLATVVLNGISEGVKGGLSPADIQTSIFNALQTVRFAIGQLDISPEAKQQLIDSINTAETDPNIQQLILRIDEQETKANAAAAAARGLEAAQTVADGRQIVLQATHDAAKSEAVGRSMVNSVKAGATQHVSFLQIGQNIINSFLAGIQGASGSVTKTVTTVVNGVTSTAKSLFKISSPSKVFLGIGEDVMKGLVEGIQNGGSSAVSALSAVVDQMLSATRGIGEAVRSGLGSLFTGLFDDLRTFGGGAAGQIQGEITTAFRGVLSAVAQNAEQLFAAASKPLAERTLTERLLTGESFVSLRVGDEFGVANRAAIASAVNAIEDFGKALLDQGATAQDAANQLAAYRAQLILTAVQAGLAQGDVENLINSLGLSSTGLQNFVTQAGQLQSIVAEGQRRAAGPTAPPLTTGPNPIVNNFATGSIQIIPPHGDPEAISLSVLNGLAQKIRR